MNHGDATGMGNTELRYRIQRDAIVGKIVGGGNDDRADGAVAELQRAVISNRRVRRHEALGAAHGETAVINMDMGIAGVNRRREAWARRAGGVWSGIGSDATGKTDDAGSAQGKGAGP